MNTPLRRDLAFLSTLVFVDTLPFLHRAIHLDENTNLAVAHHVFRNFWFPEDFTGLWFGIPLTNFSINTHPAGLPYFLALLIKLFHADATWTLRLGMVLFPLSFALGGYFLARRFTRHPLTTATLMMATPSVLVFSPTLMPDLPMATSWIWAVVSFLSGLDDGKAWKMAAAGLFLVMGTLISYQAIFMCALLGIQVWTSGPSRRIPGWKIYAALALPFLFLAVYWLTQSLHFGFWPAKRSAHYLATVEVIDLGYLRQKLLGMLSMLGAATLFCFSMLRLFVIRHGWKGFLVLLVLASAACALLPRDYSIYERGEYFVFAAAGLALLGLVTGYLWQSILKVLTRRPLPSGHLLLSLWAWGVIFYTVSLFEFSAARYILAIVPPLSILFVLGVEEVLRGREVSQRKFLLVTIFSTWVLAVAVAYADCRFVNSYRDFSHWFFQKYEANHGTTWVGTEAGLRYYMEQEGARTLVNFDGPANAEWFPGTAWGEQRFGRPATNDLMVRPEKFLRYKLSPDLEASPLIDSKTLTGSFPIRTYGPDSHAGLHGTNVGLLPFTFSRAPFDRVEIFRYKTPSAKPSF